MAAGILASKVFIEEQSMQPLQEWKREPFLPGMSPENSREPLWDTREGTEIITPLILLLQCSTPVNQHRSHLSPTLGAIRVDPGLSDQVIRSLHHSKRASQPWHEAVAQV